MVRTKNTLFAAGAVLGVSMLARPAEAKFVFAYNHPDLQWYSIETEHFVIHYPVSKKTKDEGNEHYLTTEYSARKAAEVAEQMWEPMCSQFNYYLKERIHIVMLNQSDDLEGFTIPSWDWIEVSANPGGTFYRSRGRMEWFSDVLVHEFAHVVSLKANAAHAEGAMGVEIGGLYQDGIHDVDTGAQFFIMDGDSVFWTEGGAEYWSDNAGYNWWTASRDQNIRMTTLQDRLLGYNEWHSRAGKSRFWNDHERYYQQGYSFGQYLRQRFGDQAYAQFALEYAKRWRPQWETVIEDVVGVDAETLYWDWRNYITERYQRQYEKVKDRGEVVGHEVLGKRADWEFSDPAARDDWLKQPRWKREKAQEKTGTYQWEPRISPDGRYWGVLNRADIKIHRMDEDQMFEWTGHAPQDPKRADESRRLSTHFPADFEHGWDFIPGRDAIVLTGREDMMHRGEAVTGIRFEKDGYNWKQLWVFEMPTREKKEGNRTFETRERKRVLKGLNNHEVYPKGSYHAIPNTQRGSDPSVSPDGERVAYLEYTDGTMNLVTIKLDGTDKKYLTHFKSGEWLQTPDWSPDGKKIVFAIFKNHQQNLYTINADGTDLRAITWDHWEELDAHWDEDGGIYFSAEPDGIFNIYRYDTGTGEVRQITNVIGGAFTPQISPEGNLLYTYYTAFGWKVYALPKEEFLNLPADALFNTKDIPADEVARTIAYEEDLSHWAESTKKYSSTSLMAPTGVPMIRLENDSRSNVSLSAGFYIFLQDYVEKHGLYLMSLLGEDTLLMGQYFYQGWYPTLLATAYHYEVKYDAGYILDQDEDPNTTDDQQIFEIKNQQYYNIANLGGYYPWNADFSTGVYVSGMEAGFKGTSDDRWKRYLEEVEAGVWGEFSNNSWFYGSANPWFGRTVNLTLSHAWSDIVYADYGGVAVDDGQELDAYQYNKAEMRWTEDIPMPTLGGIPVLQTAQQKHHTIQVDLRLGAIDRNVDVWDEFRAGGQHPYYWGSGALRPNTQFAGYPAYSLSGETIGILGLAYRFPVANWINWKVGPLYTTGITAQFGGTAGNLWSFRPPSDPSQYYRSRYGERIAYDPGAVRREIPFVDKAYKNGNYLLYDAQAELRVSSVLFNGSGWDSFLRVAYGFNEIRGYGDVNGDDLYDTSENAYNDELSNETEKPGFRVYIGLGTGW